ncbi:MAG: HAD-IA family hydrolase [Phycisphaerales bacterium]|nr:MAG: HAD-IA family hydrolase [Phycisphaerales bacterium]
MPSIRETLAKTKVITFDCYGTLIDWWVGLRKSFQSIFASADTQQIDELVDAYVDTEADIEGQVYRPYRDVVTEAVERLAQRFNLAIPSGKAKLLAQMLPHWTPFPDTNEALKRLKERFQLGVLSNIDRDLFAETTKHFEVTFDFVITAQDVQSYKPAMGHFERLIDQHASPDIVLHVAQSLYHDGVPTGKLGIPYVWINRYDGTNDLSVVPLALYPDLKSLADAACSD